MEVSNTSNYLEILSFMQVSKQKDTLRLKKDMECRVVKVLVMEFQSSHH